MFEKNSKRAVILLLCLLLLVPVLLPCLFVPVSAETQKYLYNGVELPALPSHPDAPYVFIEGSGRDFFLCFMQEYKFGYYSDSWDVFGKGNCYMYWMSGDIDSWGESEYLLLTEWDVCDIVSYIIWANFDILDASGNVFLPASEPVPVGGASSGIPDFVVNESWDPSLVYAFQEETTADVFTISAVLGDGWAPSYQWYYGSSQGGTFTAMPAETLAAFVPKTSVEYLGTSIYYCAVTVSVNGQSKTVNSDYLQVQVTEAPPPETEPTEPTTPTDPGGDDSGVSDKLDDVQQGLDDVQQSVDRVEDKIDQLPGEIGDSVQDAIDKENQAAENKGNDLVDQITGIVPNDSQNFVTALGGLANALMYDGTDAVLPVPALKLPGIDGLFSSCTLVEAQQVDFEHFFQMLPGSLLLLVQSLLTIALIVYCFKEFYGTLSYLFVLKGGNN